MKATSRNFRGRLFRLFACAVCLAVVTLVTSRLWRQDEADGSDVMQLSSGVVIPAGRVLRQSAAVMADDNQVGFGQERYSLVLDSDVVVQGIPFATPDVDMTFPNFYVNVSAVRLESFVFVTWVTDGNLPKLRNLLLYVQLVFAGLTTVVFDLGLSKQDQEELRAFCYVDYRKLDLSGYPEHVQVLSNRAFKPILIRNIMMTEPAIMWMELEHGLPHRIKQWDKLYSKVSKSDGIVQFKTKPRNITFRPAASMLRHIPGNRKHSLELTDPGPLLMYRSEHVYTHIVHWWYLCALDVQCYTPQYRVACPGSRDSAMCFYGDQISLDLLLSNAKNGDLSVCAYYQNSNLREEQPSVWSSRKEKLKICKPGVDIV